MPKGYHEGFRAMKVFCKRCDKKYIRTGQFQKICDKCFELSCKNRKERINSKKAVQINLMLTGIKFNKPREVNWEEYVDNIIKKKEMKNGISQTS